MKGTVKGIIYIDRTISCDDAIKLRSGIGICFTLIMEGLKWRWDCSLLFLKCNGSIHFFSDSFFLLKKEACFSKAEAFQQNVSVTDMRQTIYH